jgi:hypothetical protein
LSTRSTNFNIHPKIHNPYDFFINIIFSIESDAEIVLSNCSRQYKSEDECRLFELNMSKNVIKRRSCSDYKSQANDMSKVDEGAMYAELVDAGAEEEAEAWLTIAIQFKRR